MYTINHVFIKGVCENLIIAKERLHISENVNSSGVHIN